MSIQLTLIGKPGCHLCEEARDAIDGVLLEFRKANPNTDVALEEQNILEDDDLRLKYAEEIPVLLIDGKMHNYWRIDDERLMRALYARLRG
jgi:glutaredoxin